MIIIGDKPCRGGEDVIHVFATLGNLGEGMAHAHEDNFWYGDLIPALLPLLFHSSVDYIHALLPASEGKTFAMASNTIVLCLSLLIFALSSAFALSLPILRLLHGPKPYPQPKVQPQPREPPLPEAIRGPMRLERNLVSSEPEFVSPEPLLVSPEPKIVTMRTLIRESYRRHSDFIRSGLPMQFVLDSYNLALNQAGRSNCLFDGVVSETCVTALFVSTDGYATRALHELIMDDQGKPIQDRIFRKYIHRSNLPPWDEDEIEKGMVLEFEAKTLARVVNGTAEEWKIATFPKDENYLRQDSDNARSCAELRELTDQNSIYISSTALTAYVFGIAQQMLLSDERDETVRTILLRHVQLVHLSALCNRRTGDALKVPTIYLESMVTSCHLAMRRTSIASTLLSSFPSVTNMKDMIRGSRYFFPEAIARMSSLESFGTINLMSWTLQSESWPERFAIDLQSLDQRLLASATLEEYSEFFTFETDPDNSGNCSPTFEKNTRMILAQSREEKCCKALCIRELPLGREITRIALNEMCCDACSEKRCDQNELLQVAGIQARLFALP